jgi:succinyl-diaminopimelate desuccinylase
VGGHNGAEFLSQKILKPKLVIVPDGGENFELVIEQKGSINIVTKSFGKSAHSSRPWEGQDTIELAAKFILAIKKMFPDDLISGTTAIPTIVVSGDVHRKQVKNMIPEVCEVHWNVRISKNVSVKSIISKFKRSEI